MIEKYRRVKSRKQMAARLKKQAAEYPIEPGAAAGNLNSYGQQVTTFESGAKRDGSEVADVRFDLVCPIALRRVAQRYAMGEKKYGAHNWTKGIPSSDLLNHVEQHINKYKNGQSNKEDDNLAAAVWGLMALMHFEDQCGHHLYHEARDRDNSTMGGE